MPVVIAAAGLLTASSSSAIELTTVSAAASTRGAIASVTAPAAPDHPAAGDGAASSGLAKMLPLTLLITIQGPG